MNQGIWTYWKREVKKVIPVFAVMLAYIMATWIYVLVQMQGTTERIDLAFSYPEKIRYCLVGDVFGGYLGSFGANFQWVFVPGILFLLMLCLFNRENQPEIAEFIRVLPVRERHKKLMKLLAGELTIVLYSLVFGCVGSTVAMSVQNKFVESSQLVSTATGCANIYDVIWKMVAINFVTLSALFLILFLMQSIVHHFVAALLAGGGVILMPMYLVEIFSEFFQIPCEFKKILDAPFRVFYEMKEVMLTGPFQQRVLRYSDSLYQSKIYFWLTVCVLTLVLWYVSERLYWGVKEANNVYINSPVVMSFLTTGLYVCVGMGISGYVQENIPRGVVETRNYGRVIRQFFATSVTATVVLAVLTFLAVCLWRIQRKKETKGGEERWFKKSRRK